MAQAPDDNIPRGCIPLSEYLKWAGPMLYIYSPYEDVFCEITDEMRAAKAEFLAKAGCAAEPSEQELDGHTSTTDDVRQHRSDERDASAATFPEVPGLTKGSMSGVDGHRGPQHQKPAEWKGIATPDGSGHRRTYLPSTYEQLGGQAPHFQVTAKNPGREGNCQQGALNSRSSGRRVSEMEGPGNDAAEDSRSTRSSFNDRRTRSQSVGRHRSREPRENQRRVGPPQRSTSIGPRSQDDPPKTIGGSGPKNGPWTQPMAGQHQRPHGSKTQHYQQNETTTGGHPRGRRPNKSYLPNETAFTGGNQRGPVPQNYQQPRTMTAGGYQHGPAGPKNHLVQGLTTGRGPADKLLGATSVVPRSQDDPPKIIAGSGPKNGPWTQPKTGWHQRVNGAKTYYQQKDTTTGAYECGPGLNKSHQPNGFGGNPIGFGPKNQPREAVAGGYQRGAAGQKQLLLRGIVSQQVPANRTVGASSVGPRPQDDHPKIITGSGPKNGPWMQSTTAEHQRVNGHKTHHQQKETTSGGYQRGSGPKANYQPNGTASGENQRGPGSNKNHQQIERMAAGQGHQRGSAGQMHLLPQGIVSHQIPANQTLGLLPTRGQYETPNPPKKESTKKQKEAPEEKGNAREPGGLAVGGGIGNQAVSVKKNVDYDGVIMWEEHVSYEPLRIGEVIYVTVLAEPHFEQGLPFHFGGVVSNVTAKEVYDKVDEMDAQVAEYGRKIPTNASYIPQPGELVLAPFEGNYYRAVVIDKTRVWFLDYCNVGGFEVGELKRFPQQFLRKPPLCHLFNILGGQRKLDNVVPGQQTFVVKGLGRYGMVYIVDFV